MIMSRFYKHAAVVAGMTIPMTTLVVGTAVAATPAPLTPASLATYQALPASRVLDTRNGIGAQKAQVASGGHVAVQVEGRGGVPSSGVTAVVLNVTVTRPVGAGNATVWADGIAQPIVSNINYVAGQTVPNLVFAPVGADGKVDIGVFRQADVIADVAGYYLGGSSTGTAGGFGSLTPTRLLDTRNGVGAARAQVPSGGFVPLQVAGRGGVPATGVSAVVLNVTVTRPLGAGNVTVYADGTAQPPPVSNLNYVTGQTVANLVVAPVGADGKVDLAVFRQADLIADVAGYFLGGTPSAPGTYGALPPQRLLDTRYGVGAPKAKLSSGAHLAIQVAGRGGVPSTGVAAVVLNVTVTAPTGAGNATVWGDGAPEPGASNINYVTGQTVPNLVLAPVGADGKVDIGVFKQTDLIADVSGYLTIGSPTTSTSRYVRNIVDANPAGDATTLHTEGCTDATANGGSGNHVMVLDIGAQTITAPLSSLNPGVALSGLSPTVRVSDTTLVTAIDGYIDGYASCNTGTGNATIVVSTTNDGDWTGYPATKRAPDWATKVIVPLQTHAAAKTHIQVAAGMDAEAGFASTEMQVESWITTFLATAGTGMLVMHGSADFCPSTLGQVRTSCGPVDNGNGGVNTWTQAQYYRLTHGLSPSRIVALPQIYSTLDAARWANIDQTGASATDKIAFIGALTSQTACGQLGGCTSLGSVAGFDAFAADLSSGTFTAPTALTVATDLRSDSPS